MAPLAAYLFLLGVLNVGPRPVLIAGSRDAAALGVALGGFVVAGPMELFAPETAFYRFGPWAWLGMLAVYALAVTLVITVMRPRLVIYNMGTDQLRPILADVAGQLDAEARWAGGNLAMPNLGVQLSIEPFAAMHNLQLAATGVEQSFAGWRQLERQLARSLRTERVGPNARAFSFFLFALFIVGMLAVNIVVDRHDIMQSLFDMLRLER